MGNTNTEVCPVCGQVHPQRKELDKSCTKEELDGFRLLKTRVDVAQQMLQSVGGQGNGNAAHTEAMVSGALNAKAEAMYLQQNWWSEMIAKYDLPKNENVFIDTNTGAFYVQVAH